jgi:hypothetical protein
MLMSAIPRSIRRTLVVALIGLWAVACSKPSYIDIAYRLPPESLNLSGKAIGLRLEDLRADKEIFAGKAKKEYEFFTGLFSLSLQEGDMNHIVGTYDLPALFREAFKRRIQQTGVEILDTADPDRPVITVYLKKFLLEGSGGKWLADISYEARLTRGEKTLATQSVSGKAERVKLIGLSGAEKVLGEIFTDSLNKFDIGKLFREAKL